MKQPLRSSTKWWQGEVWGENAGGPFPTLHGPPLERPRGAWRRPCGWSQSLPAGRRKHRAERGPHPRLQNSCSKSSLEAWCPAQQDWPLFQSAGAASSPGDPLWGRAPLRPGLPSPQPWILCREGVWGRPSSRSRTSEDWGPVSIEFCVGRDVIL